MGAGDMPAGPGPARLPRWELSNAVLVTVVAAAWVVLSEIDRLIEGVVGESENQSVAETVGVGAWGARDRAWDIWGSDPDAVRGLLVAHTLVDLLFFLALGLLLIRWAAAAAPRRVARTYIALEGVEAFLLLASSGALDDKGVSAWVTWPLAVVALGKWAAVLLYMLLQFGDQGVRARLGVLLLRLRRALFFQRLSLVVVLVVAVLSLLPLPNIWDQLPDVQRQWVDDRTGAWHLLAALLSVGAVTAGLWVLGRQRAERAVSAYDSEQQARKPAQYWWWLIGPVTAALVAGAFLWARSSDDLIDWKTLSVFVGLPLALVVVSEGLRRWRGLGNDDYLPDHDPQRAKDVWRVGDALALLLPWATGLALVRSFTAPVFVPASGQAAVTDRWVYQSLLWLVGLAAALVLSVLIRRVAATTGPGAPAPGVPAAEVRPGGRATALQRRLGSEVAQLLDPNRPAEATRWPLVTWIASIVALLAFLLWPFLITEALGVVSTMLLALGAWVLFVGFLMVRLQKQQPLPLFKMFNLRANPLLTLLVALPLLANITNPGGDLHAIRGEASKAPQPPSLKELVETWYDASGDCDRTVQDVPVRPMLLVAASGGGIRAAYWTATVMDAIRASRPCGSRAVLLSSGVSGGSVGLALSRAGSGIAGVEALADPDALSAAISGLMVGDMVGGMTGLRIPAFGEGETAWLDRGGLMERVWERQAPSLAEPFRQLTKDKPEVPSGPAGALLLNSAVAGVGCRVLVSDIDLGSSKASPSSAPTPSPPADVSMQDAGGRCTTQNDRPAASLDLRDLYPPGCQQPALRLSTAAMLSARFPTVTPGGQLPATGENCEPRPDAPLVDGGYAEGSGVGTLADLAPALSEVVRKHNAQAGKTIIVPIVVYLEDAARSDLAPAPVRSVPEAFVPLAGLNAGAAQVTSGAWLQRTAAALSRSCPEAAPVGCDAASDALRDRLTGGVVVVAPRTKPGVDAPLGWTLSQDSRTRLAEAVKDQLTACGDVVGDYTCLADLLSVLREGEKQS